MDILFESSDVELHDVTSDSPYVIFTANGETQRLDCDYVAGCDGQHGVSRTAIPDDAYLNKSESAQASIVEQYVGMDL